MKTEEGPPSDAAVAQCLAGVKREGGTVLVVGAAREAHDELCDRFREGDREELVVRTDSRRDGSRSVADAAAVIDRPVPTRSSAATQSDQSALDVRSVGEELRLEMRSLTASAETVSVCFDSLRPFVDTADVSTLCSELEAIRAVARDGDVVVHFHLPAVPDAIPVPIFDAVDVIVTVVQQGESSYQQWHLPAEGETTDWVEI